MKVHILAVIKDILQKRFEEILKEPEFSKVKFERSNGWTSYSMFEYSLAWSRFTAAVDKKVIPAIGDPNGIFTRKHSAKVLQTIGEIANGITAKEAAYNPERFKTWLD